MRWRSARARRCVQLRRLRQATQEERSVPNTCHREFHHDSQGIDATTDAVFHYDCTILAWIIRLKLAVTLQNGTRNLQGMWIKR